VPLALKTTKQELKRLNRSQITPDVRYHYRIIAAKRALDAAALLPDQNESLADILNMAGNWVSTEMNAWRIAFTRPSQKSRKDEHWAKSRPQTLVYLTKRKLE